MCPQCSRVTNKHDDFCSDECSDRYYRERNDKH